MNLLKGRENHVGNRPSRAKRPPAAAPPPNFLQGNSRMNIVLKAKYSFISSLIFFIVASPETYKLTQSMFGGLFQIVGPTGCATPWGLLLHTTIFFATMLGLMMIPAL